MFRGADADDARRITQRYPVYSFGGAHSGIDIVTISGNSNINSMAVYPVADGTVTFANFTTGYGQTVIIRHTDNPNITTLYAHFETDSIPAGILDTEISSSLRIGRVGFTGITAAYTWHGGQPNETDAHLHFEVRVNNSTRNPVDYYPNGLFSMPNY
jgi:murein DD-endopeptidase MepM/ murein hydrolase activator NlpD